MDKTTTDFAANKEDQEKDPPVNSHQDCQKMNPSTKNSEENEQANEVTCSMSEASVVHTPQPGDLTSNLSTDETLSKHVVTADSCALDDAAPSAMDTDVVTQPITLEEQSEGGKVAAGVSTAAVQDKAVVESSKQLPEQANEILPSVLKTSVVHPPDQGDLSRDDPRDEPLNEHVATESCNAVSIANDDVPCAMESDIIAQTSSSEGQSESSTAAVDQNTSGNESTTTETQKLAESAPAPLVLNADETDPTQPAMEMDSSRMQQCLNASGLTLLAAQYDSDSDSDDVCEVPPVLNYQNRVVEIDSDSSSSDVEVLGEDQASIDLDMLNSVQGDDDDEENVRCSRPPKVKGELQYDDLPPIQDLHITVPEEECTELGKIQSIIEQLVLVNSLPGTVPLDLETVLFLEKGKLVLGEIFDVLGQVSDPLYCVRFNSNKEIKEKGIEVGQTVYVAPRTQHTQFIVLANLMKVRGSDASWENDVEPPPRYLDYSDDEEEREARQSIRNRNRPVDTDDEEPKRQRYGGPPFAPRGRFPPTRPYRGHNPGQSFVRQPHYQPPSNYDIAGNSWHSNYYQNFVHPQQQHQQYRMPVHPQNSYRGPHPNMPPGSSTGMVLNPYAVFTPPPLMQQPLFPPPQYPPPPPPGEF